MVDVRWAVSVEARTLSRVSYELVRTYSTVLYTRGSYKTCTVQARTSHTLVRTCKYESYKSLYETHTTYVGVA